MLNFVMETHWNKRKVRKHEKEMEAQNDAYEEEGLLYGGGITILLKTSQIRCFRNFFKRVFLETIFFIGRNTSLKIYEPIVIKIKSFLFRKL